MNNLRPGTVIELHGDPYEVLESHHAKVARGQATTQTKIKNLISGKVLARTFGQSDKIAPANVEKVSANFKYRTKNELFFVTVRGKKIGFSEAALGEKLNYLKIGTEVTLVIFKEEPIAINLPIKMQFRVKEAPPTEKGNTAQGGTKDVIIETGAKVKTPMFVRAGDNIEINTISGEYVRRVN